MLKHCSSLVLPHWVLANILHSNDTDTSVPSPRLCTPLSIFHKFIHNLQFLLFFNITTKTLQQKRYKTGIFLPPLQNQKKKTNHRAFALLKVSYKSHGPLFYLWKSEPKSVQKTFLLVWFPTKNKTILVVQ